MVWHKQIWNYLIVTLVAVLIWAWAASETRERKSLPSAKVQFVVAEAANWIVTPVSVPLSLNVEGTKLAVQRLADRLRNPVQIMVSVNTGRQTIDLVDQLSANDDIMATGATIVSTDPSTVEIEVDQIDRIQAPVKPSLPGVTPEGEIVVQPREVTISLPHSARQRLPQDFAVEAFIDRRELDLLEPGTPQSMEVRLRLPETVPPGSDIKINPPKAMVNFTIRSRIRETLVDSVRVQVAGPPEDRDAFQIEVEPKVLRGVSVLADADLSRQIEAGDVPVVAIVHLSSREKEALIPRKPVSYYLAMVPEVDGGTRYVQLNSKPGTEMPEINLTISNRAE